MRKNCFFARFAPALLLAFVLPASVQADFMLRLDDPFKGAKPASTNTPWITAWFHDTGPGTVSLTISNVSLTANETVDALYFNVSPSLNASSLTLNGFQHGGEVDRPMISLGRDHFKADGSGKYDIMLSFSKGGNISDRFTQSDFISYNISGIPNLTSSDFEYASAKPGMAGPFYAAAHISQIGRCFSDGWISATSPLPVTPIPEPGASLLLSLGLGLWMSHRIWKRAQVVRNQTAKLAPIQKRPISERKAVATR